MIAILFLLPDSTTNSWPHDAFRWVTGEYLETSVEGFIEKERRNLASFYECEPDTIHLVSIIDSPSDFDIESWDPTDFSTEG